MPDQALAPVPGGGVPIGSARFIPPLPAGIPILPGQVTAPRAARRRPVGLIFLLVLAGLAGFIWFGIRFLDTQNANRFKRIDDENALVLQAITPAMMRRAPRLTIIPVTLSGGPRLLQISFTVVHRNPGKPPSTCVFLNVLDPKTRAFINEISTTPCIAGLDYPIKQQ
jgi:hypothetical protein